MLFPTSSDHQEKTPQSQNEDPVVVSVEERLECILSKIKGAGEVSVMLLEAYGQEVIYQTDSTITNDSTKNDTVTLTDSERNQNGLIRKIVPPKYAGAIIICSGADDPQIKLAIVEAVSGITGLGSDRISVLKMK